MQIEPLPGDPLDPLDLSAYEPGDPLDLSAYELAEAAPAAYADDYDPRWYRDEIAGLKVIPAHYTADKIRQIAADPDSYQRHRPAILAQVQRGRYTAERVKELGRDPRAWADHKPFILAQIAHDFFNVRTAHPHRCNSCGALKT